MNKNNSSQYSLKYLSVGILGLTHLTKASPRVKNKKKLPPDVTINNKKLD